MSTVTIPILQEELRRLGGRTSGTKSILISRLARFKNGTQTADDIGHQRNKIESPILPTIEGKLDLVKIEQELPNATTDQLKGFIKAINPILETRNIQRGSLGGKKMN